MMRPESIGRKMAKSNEVQKTRKLVMRLESSLERRHKQTATEKCMSNPHILIEPWYDNSPGGGKYGVWELDNAYIGAYDPPHQRKFH